MMPGSKVHAVKLHWDLGCHVCNVHPTASSTDSNLKDELLPVRAGVIRGFCVLRHKHVELGHTILQVLVQLCNLDNELLMTRCEPQYFTSSLI